MAKSRAGGHGRDEQRDLLLTCMRTLLASSEERVYFKDLESRFLFVSKGWADAFAGGLGPDEMTGKTDFDVFSEDHAANAYADEQRIIRTGEPIVQKVELETYWGRRETWVSTTKVPLRDERGRIIGTFGMSRDITPQIRAENDMARQALQLSTQNEELRDFLGLASRELRQQLSSVIAEIGLLREQRPRDLLAAPVLATLERDAREFLRVLEGLLLLPSVQAGQLAMELRAADLAGAAAGALEEMRPLAQAKHVDLTFAGGAVPRFAIDPLRIGQLLGNLISNAVKSTAAGGKVEVKTGVDGGDAVVTISDTGSGISAADREALAGRAGVPGQGATPGGIGLTISKAIVEAHHGTMAAVDQEGGGTRVEVRLPLRPVPAGGDADGGSQA